MKTKTDLLIDTLTNDSGRRVFTINETKQLIKISQLEAINDEDELNKEILKFKQSYVDSVSWKF